MNYFFLCIINMISGNTLVGPHCFSHWGGGGGGWGMNRGVQIHRSVPFFREIGRSAKIFVQIRNNNHFRKQKCKGLKVKLVHVNATVNFTQIVKKAACLMAITQYNSN